MLKKYSHSLIICIFLLITWHSVSTSASTSWQALAHRDSDQEKPLFGSINNGMTYIEFDVHLKDGCLLIGHDEDDLEPDRTLESMYLAPLMKHVQEKKGYLFQDNTSLKLMVDIKTDAEETYIVLDHILGRYANILMHYKEGILLRGPIQIIVSGNRAIEAISSAEPRYAFIDGRIENLDQPIPHQFMPIISDSWNKILPGIQHNTHEAYSAAETRYISDILTPLIAIAKNLNTKFRLWGDPDDTATWALLLDLGQDTIVINTDTPKQLNRFLNEMTNNGVFCPTPNKGKSSLQPSSLQLNVVPVVGWWGINLLLLLPFRGHVLKPAKMAKFEFPYIPRVMK